MAHDLKFSYYESLPWWPGKTTTLTAQPKKTVNLTSNMIKKHNAILMDS